LTDFLRFKQQEMVWHSYQLCSQSGNYFCGYDYTFFHFYCGDSQLGIALCPGLLTPGLLLAILAMLGWEDLDMRLYGVKVVLWAKPMTTGTRL